MSVAYHVAGARFAPNGWLTASVWDWIKLFPSLVAQAINKTYKPSVQRFYLKDGVIGTLPL